MSLTTDYELPRVLGIDITSNLIHLSVIDTDDPDTALAAAVPVVSQPPYSLFNVHHHVQTAVNQAVDLITDGDTSLPALVVCSKFMWRDMKTDPSAARRSMVHTLLLEQLHRLRVPVTEFPLPTALVWARGSGVGKTGGMLDLLDDLAVTKLSAKKPAGQEKYRPGTGILAAIAAQSIGMEVGGFPVNDERLSRAAGYATPTARTKDNRSINWTSRRVPPRSVAEWETRNKDIAGWLRAGDTAAALGAEGESETAA